MRRVAALLLAVAAEGCLALPPTSAERLNQSAFRLNNATRFGRMDIAAEDVVAEAKADFGKRHRAWGRDVRIMDLEVEGVEMLSSDTAQVDLVVSWQHVNGMEIHATSVAQRWVQSASDWKLAEETVSAGSSALFPAAKPKKEAAASGSPSATDAERPQATEKRSALAGSVDLP